MIKRTKRISSLYNYGADHSPEQNVRYRKTNRKFYHLIY